MFLELILATTAAVTPPQHKFLELPNIYLFSTEALVRVLDAESTRANLTNPCKCFIERNTPAISKTNAGAYGYSAAVSVATIGLSYLAHRTNHHKVERLIPVFDFSYDSHDVAHNYAIRNKR
jgi:hypothetical protein